VIIVFGGVLHVTDMGIEIKIIVMFDPAVIKFVINFRIMTAYA